MKFLKRKNIDKIKDNFTSYSEFLRYVSEKSVTDKEVALCKYIIKNIEEKLLSTAKDGKTELSYCCFNLSLANNAWVDETYRNKLDVTKYLPPLLQEYVEKLRDEGFKVKVLPYCTQDFMFIIKW